MVEEKQYAVDQEKLKEYFPMEVASHHSSYCTLSWHVFFKVVTAGLMDIYQRILGLKFTKIEGGEVMCILFCVVIACSCNAHLQVWHEDVEQWRVDDATTGGTIGYFYLDLYPRLQITGVLLTEPGSNSISLFSLRDGKYGHACMMQLQPGCLDSEGKRQKSVVVMITNFSKVGDR